MSTIANVILTGSATNNYFGRAVSSAGDVNGDGYSDVIVGAYGYTTTTGRAYIYFGGASMNNIADVTLTGETTFNSFGISVSTAGDVNGDGFSDLTDIVITYNNAAKFIQKSIPLSEPEILAQNENDQNIFNQNSAAQNREYINREMRIDHEIYDKTKNQFTNQKNIPDIKIISKDGSEKFIKGSINMRKNR